MTYTMLKGKIHRAVVKQADLNYVGSITVDTELLEAAGIMEYELVQIVDVENGNRFETYTIAGEPGSDLSERRSCKTGGRGGSCDPHVLCADDTGGSKTAQTESCFCGWGESYFQDDKLRKAWKDCRGYVRE